MARATRILMVEDDPNLRRILSYHLERLEYTVVQVADGRSALDRLAAEPFDLVVTDVRMAGMDGIELLRAIREKDPDLPVVVMTAYGTIQDAVEAMRLGAADYLTKPVERETLLLTVQKALRVSDLRKENRRLRENLQEKRPVESILGTSAPIQKLLDGIRRVAPTDATVLITGESGTGKELVARALHSLSPRVGKPFVAINCAAMPRDLLESELFGHERGAFTGATETKPGKFVQANGGTLFLDEIGDMDLSLQAKILRALQERVVDPVGSRASKAVDVRVLAATHRDLSGAVKAGAFREDLYWRLNVIPLGVPPLRERVEDVAILFSHFCRQYGGSEPKLEAAAMAILRNYRWPGNVRELQSLCQRLAILHPGQAVAPAMLPPEMRGIEQEGGSPAEGLWGLEREAIVRALREHNGNQSAAARSLRIPRHILIYRMKKYGLS
ncbi:MAG: sigma-54 dependent transcriptional regulator [Acidobacteriota bacterium]